MIEVQCPECLKLICKISPAFRGGVQVYCRACREEILIESEWTTEEGRIAKPKRTVLKRRFSMVR